jgi:hypothetical protein
MAHRHRTKTRAARRIAERTQRNVAAVDAGVEAEEDAKTRPRNARHAAQLDVLLHRHVITTDQARAGGRFSRDFHLSGTVIGQLTSRYEPNLPKKPKRYAAPPPDTPHAIEARERFEQAMAALGPLSPIALHVCICDLPASAWGANGKPNGDAVGLLRYALSVLAVHYVTVRYPTASAEALAAPPANLSHSLVTASAAAPA